MQSLPAVLIKPLDYCMLAVVVNVSVFIGNMIIKVKSLWCTNWWKR